MAFNVNGLSEYVKIHESEIALDIVSKAKTFEFLQSRGRVMYGLKTKEQIRLMSNEISLQDGSGCGWNPLGDTTLTAKTIEVYPIKDQSEVCFKSLYNTVFNAGLSLGQDPETETNDEVYKKVVSNKTDILAAANEKMLWQGDRGITASYGDGYQNINKVDGYLKKITTGGTSSYLYLGATASGATVVEQLQNIFKQIPVDISSHPSFVMGIGNDVANLYRIELSNKDKRAVDVNGFEVLFGTDARLETFPGLNGTKKVVYGNFDELVVATDGQGQEWDEAKISYSEETEKHKLGFRYALGTEIVYKKNIGVIELVY